MPVTTLFVLVLLPVAACSTVGTELEPVTEVRTDVQAGTHRLGTRVWGLQPSDPMPELAADEAAARRGRASPSAAGQSQDPQGRPNQEPSDQERATLRARFGATILIARDGTITKQYFLTGEGGQVLLNLLTEPDAAVPANDFGPLKLGGSSGSKSILGQMLGDQEAEVFYFDEFEIPEGVNLATSAKKPLDGTPLKPVPGAPTSLLLVSAKPDALSAFESALDMFFANIPQVEIEIKVVEYTTIDALGFGISPLGTSPTLEQLSSKKLIQDITSQFPLTFPVAGTASLSDRGLITLGGIHDAWQLNARLEALESAGVADILSSPKLVVRNGGTASVSTKTDFPYPKASISASGQNVTSDIRFRPVGITLNIRPTIAGTQTVILQVFASISAATSFADTDPVDTPIISSRQIATSVHVSDGKTTVVGGLVSSSTFEQTTQVPVLGDIPILGYLFRTTSTTKQKTTLEFHITPRIIQGAGSYVGGN